MTDARTSYCQWKVSMNLWKTLISIQPHHDGGQKAVGGVSNLRKYRNCSPSPVVRSSIECRPSIQQSDRTSSASNITAEPSKRLRDTREECTLKTEDVMEQNERRLWLIKELLRESGEYRGIMIPKDEDGRRQLLRGLMNVRMPGPICRRLAGNRVRYLQEELKRKGITDVRQLEPLQDENISLAGRYHDSAVRRHRERRQQRNDGMLSPQPSVHRQLHPHFQRRSVQFNACAGIMERQGHAEGTGHAKITEAYNLPCRYVLPASWGPSCMAG